MAFPVLTRCIEITQPGGPDVLALAERELPAPGPGQVLIRVAAAGINRPDVFQREGKYPPPPGASDIPGLEVAGTVAAVGEGVTAPSVGDKVCALLSGGGYGDYALADAELCLPVPGGFSMVEAAALPETFFTVWFNLVEQGGLAEGDIVLVHGGSSGIGTTAIQVARALGARVFTTAGSDEKCRACEALGAEKAFNYKTEDFTAIKAITDGHGADIIIDMVGGDYVQKNIKAAARKGRIISLAFLKGSKVEVDLMPVMLKQLVLTGSTLRSQPLAVKARLAAALRDQLWPLLASGRIRPVIAATFPLARANDAHRLMESSGHIGKIVLDCTDSESR